MPKNADPAPVQQSGPILKWVRILSALNAEVGHLDPAREANADCEGGPNSSNIVLPFPRRSPVVLTPGARLGPYEIVAPLGSGGMGVVYRAHDSRLNRTVAIKVLAAPKEGMQLRQRFQREMRAIAALNHPHICALYDAGLEDDVEFFVMEYLEGETLANRLLKGALPVAEALQHAAALADAVALAHRHGIVHRDIKPSNIMLTSAGVKLLDFGLAKVSQVVGTAKSALGELQTESTDITGAHTILGTLKYMAPEQLEGREADARTDIFALGVVFYEMVTGERAFPQNSDAGIVSAIIAQDPVPLIERQPQTPPDFDFAVSVCLAKNPDERWQSAHDLARALQWIRQGGAVPAPKLRTRAWPRRRMWLAAAALALVTIVGVLAAFVWMQRSETANLVILPCKVLGGPPLDQAYCDGLNETLSAKLAPLTASHALQLTHISDVRSRNVNTVLDARREFGATLVLEGSLLREGDTLRVSYDLVDARTLRHVEGYSFMAASGDPFGVQDRVVQWAASVLAPKLSDDERRSLVEHDTSNPVAHALYLQGDGYLTDLQTPSNLDNAIESFGHALELDPRYAFALSGLGRAYWQKFAVTADAKWASLARESCEKAREIDAQLPAAHLCIGTVANGSGRYADARAEFLKVLELDEINEEAFSGLAFAEEHLGNLKAAEETYRRAIERRPTYWAGYTRLAQFYKEQGRYDEAATEFREALNLTPDNPAAWWSIGSVYLYKGRYTEAVDAYQHSLSLSPTFTRFQALGMTFYRMRRFDDAIAAFEQARRLSTHYRGPGSLARVYYWQGKRVEARALFETAIAGIEQSLAVNPNDVDAHLLMAEFHAKLGHRIEAVTQLNAAGDISNDPHRLMFAAFVHNHLGDRSAALDLLEKAAKKGLPKAELRAWPELDSLHDDRRFQSLLSGP